MKVVVFDNNYKTGVSEKELNWYVVADSAFSNGGKPFFLPEDMGEATVSISPAIRICRLGKSVLPRFANRYFHEFALAFHFRLNNLYERMKAAGKPISEAVSFDRSIMVSDFSELENDLKDLSLELKINGQLVKEFFGKEMTFGPEILISRFSQMNTLKMGDVILLSLSPGVIIREGDYLQLSYGDRPEFTIKVK